MKQVRHTAAAFASAVCSARTQTRARAHTHTRREGEGVRGSCARERQRKRKGEVCTTRRKPAMYTSSSMMHGAVNSGSITGNIGISLVALTDSASCARGRQRRSKEPYITHKRALSYPQKRPTARSACPDICNPRPYTSNEGDPCSNLKTWSRCSGFHSMAPWSLPKSSLSSSPQKKRSGPIGKTRLRTRFRVPGLGFRASCLGFRVQGSRGSGVRGFWFRVSGLGFMV